MRDADSGLNSIVSTIPLPGNVSSRSGGILGGRSYG
jgi:hypothetical protein